MIIWSKQGFQPDLKVESAPQERAVAGFEAPRFQRFSEGTSLSKIWLNRCSVSKRYKQRSKQDKYDLRTCGNADKVSIPICLMLNSLVESRYIPTIVCVCVIVNSLNLSNGYASLLSGMTREVYLELHPGVLDLSASSEIFVWDTRAACVSGPSPKLSATLLNGRWSGWILSCYDTLYHWRYTCYIMSL